ncbi:hypothetical protein C2E23DRAFT_856632 [Lenzites betulinus]|nr:hypothetical protein C2E23DRAFT_856632 [Lenzites betulinus]
MRSSIFFAFITLSISVQALPLALRSESANLTTLSSSNSTLVTISAASTSLPVSLTSLPSLTATLAFGNGSVSVTATDVSATASLATAYTTYYFASPTDTASNSSFTGYASAASNFAYSTAEPTATAVSFDIPDVPPACLALTSGGVLPQTSALPTSSDASFIPLTTLSPSGSLSTSPILSTTASNATITPTATANSTLSALPTDVASNTTLYRRIAQDDLPAVAQSWQDLCLVSGGDIFTNEPCVQLAGVNGINALLADADPCAQQDNADEMIDFAHAPGVTNTDALIANAVAYAGHPRNALNINGVVPSTPFCLRAPRNLELAGVVRPQLEGVNPGIYGSVSLGLFAFGADGTCPFGQTADVSTCGCS